MSNETDRDKLLSVDISDLIDIVIQAQKVRELQIEFKEKENKPNYGGRLFKMEREEEKLDKMLGEI